jgi:hypothetical protein
VLYRLLADAVLVVHLGYILFAVAGALLCLRWRGVPWLHLPAVGWAVTVQVGGFSCPLTPLENRLRLLGGQAGYDGGFIEHYLLAVIYPDGLTRQIQIVLAGVVLAVNVAVYGWLWWSTRGARAFGELYGRGAVHG